MGCRSRIRLLLGSAIFALALVRCATADTYDVDPDNSYLSIAILDHSTQNQLTSAQVDGSDLTSLGGSFDVTFGSGTITFNSSNNITFGNQSTDMQPAIGGGSASAGTGDNPYPADPGSGAANYGLYFTVPNDFDNPDAGLALAGVAAIRGALTDVTSSAISLSDGLFDASQLTMSLPNGHTALDFNVNLGDGTPLANGTSFVDGSGANSETFGEVGTIFGVPFVGFYIDLDIHTTAGGLDLDVVLQGQIVGSLESGGGVIAVPVPEPETLALAVVAAVCFVPVLRRRRKV